jgi:hypothetical protein
LQATTNIRFLAGDAAYTPPPLSESAAPCAIHYGLGAQTVGIAVTAGEVGEAGLDAHRGVGDGDLQHLHGAVAEEQLWRRAVAVPAGDVEAGEVAP